MKVLTFNKGGGGGGGGGRSRADLLSYRGRFYHDHDWFLLSGNESKFYASVDVLHPRIAASPSTYRFEYLADTNPNPFTFLSLSFKSFRKSDNKRTRRFLCVIKKYVVCWRMRIAYRLLLSILKFNLIAIHKFSWITNFRNKRSRKKIHVQSFIIHRISFKPLFLINKRSISLETVKCIMHALCRPTWFVIQLERNGHNSRASNSS